MNKIILGKFVKLDKLLTCFSCKCSKRFLKNAVDIWNHQNKHVPTHKYHTLILIAPLPNSWTCYATHATPPLWVGTPLIGDWLEVCFALRSIRKSSSLCPNPFKGFTLWSESFEGLKGVGDQTTVSWSALLHHHPVPIWRCRHHGKNQHKESWGGRSVHQLYPLKSFIP